MAEITEARKKMESSFMGDYWNMRKAIAEPEENDEYWNNLLKVTSDMGKKYGNDLYVESVLLACIIDIESRSKAYARGDLSLRTLNAFRQSRGLLPVKEETV